MLLELLFEREVSRSGRLRLRSQSGAVALPTIARNRRFAIVASSSRAAIRLQRSLREPRPAATPAPSVGSSSDGDGTFVGMVVHAIFVDRIEERRSASSSRACEIGSYLWSWQRAHSSVSPSMAVPNVWTRSDAFSTSHSSAIEPPFVRQPMQAIERRGQDLVAASAFGSRSPANCQVMKLVVRQIVVERAHDPIAVRPLGIELIGLIAVRIGIARRIEPGDRRVRRTPCRRATAQLPQRRLGRVRRARPVSQTHALLREWAASR